MWCLQYVLLLLFSFPPSPRAGPCANTIRLYVLYYVLYTIYIPAPWLCGSLGRKQISGSPDQLLIDRSQNLAQQAGYGPCNSIWGDQSSCWRCRNCHGNSKPKIRVRPEPRGEANKCWRLSSRKAVHLTSVISMCPDYM
ncbi:hypothetical protein V8C40DRAFT_244438 [Trichoderma camerunense]